MDFSYEVALDEVEELLRVHDYPGVLKQLRDIDIDSLTKQEFTRHLILHSHADLYLGNLSHDNIDKAFKYLNPSSSPDEFARAKLIKGTIYSKQGNFSEAVQQFIEASVYYRISGDKENTAVVLNLLGWARMQVGEFETGNSNMLDAVALFKELRDKSDNDKYPLRICQITHNLAYQSIQYGRIKEGLDLYITNPISIEDLSSKTSINYILNLSVAYSYVGRTYEARFLLAECLPFLKEKKQERALYWQNLGISYQFDHSFRKAIRCYASALKHLNTDKSYLYPGLQRWTGECYFELREWGLSLDHTSQSLEAASISGEKVEIAACHRTMALLSAREEEINEAINFFSESMRVLKEIDSRYELAKTYFAASISGVYDALESAKYARQAERYFASEGIPQLGKNVNFQIRLHNAMKEFRKKIGLDLRSLIGLSRNNLS